jgi:MFS transporter, DHA1 family, multidrug resistance protein
MIIGSVRYSVGLFWFAWTSDPDLTWVPRILSGLPIGAGTVHLHANSQLHHRLLSDKRQQRNCGEYGIALGRWRCHSSVRNLHVRGISAPVTIRHKLLTAHRHHDLGVNWTTSLLAFPRVACLPFPILFYQYAPKSRFKSKYAPNP